MSVGISGIHLSHLSYRCFLGRKPTAHFAARRMHSSSASRLLPVPAVPVHSHHLKRRFGLVASRKASNCPTSLSLPSNCTNRLEYRYRLLYCSLESEGINSGGFR